MDKNRLAVKSNKKKKVVHFVPKKDSVMVYGHDAYSEIVA